MTGGTLKNTVFYQNRESNGGLKIGGETEGSWTMHQIPNGDIEERQGGINMDYLDKEKYLYYVGVHMMVEI